MGIKVEADAYMAIREGSKWPSLIYGNDVDVQRMDCVNNLIFAITTDV